MEKFPLCKHIHKVHSLNVRNWNFKNIKKFSDPLNIEPNKIENDDNDVKCERSGEHENILKNVLQKTTAK